MLEWVLFDADDTLFDFRKAARLAFFQTFEQLNLVVEPAWFEIYESYNKAAWTEYEDRQIDSQTLRSKRFAGLFKHINRPNLHDPAAFNDLYLQLLVENSHLLDGALDLLNALHGKVKMAVITNGLHDVQRPRIKKQNVGHFFDEIVVSEEIGCAKPQIEYFEYTFRSLGQPPKDRVLVVGDNLSSDIQGAKNFGLKSCWYNPSGKENPGPHFPEYEIRGLDEVREIVLG
jgi:2-haloacid dehalogenase